MVEKPAHWLALIVLLAAAGLAPEAGSQAVGPAAKGAAAAERPPGPRPGPRVRALDDKGGPQIRGRNRHGPFGRLYYTDRYWADRLEVRPAGRPIEQLPPAPPEETEPATRPDPGQPAPRLRARGSDRVRPAFAVGDRLPAGMPQVTLDWRTYGLPEPEPGTHYARVERDVLLLEAASRRVLARVEPDDR